MEPPGGGRDSRFNLGYSMNLLSGGETPSEIYNTPSLGGGRVGGLPSTSLQQLSPPPGSRHHQQSMLSGSSCAGNSRSSGTSLKSDICYDDRGMSAQGGGMGGMEGCGGVSDMSEDTYGGMQPKKSPPSNGKKTKGRVKIKMEYIENKLRRYTTFSKRKTGIMKKAYELSTLTGTQVMLLVASETGHVYTFATRKLQPMITSEAGKALIQTCLNSPDPPAGSASGDQRMSATGFEETELTYNISDEDSKDENISGGDSSDSSEAETHEDETEIIFVPQQQQPPPQKSSSNSTTPSAPPSLISIANLPKNSQKNSRGTNSGTSGGQTSSGSNHNNNNLTTSISISQPTTTSSNNNNGGSSQQQQNSSKVSSNSAGPPPPLLSPLVYPTPQGMMYATQNGGMIFSIAPHQSNDSGSGGVHHHHHHTPQFITIPLSMVTAAANGGQTGGELDLSSKRSSNK